MNILVGIAMRFQIAQKLRVRYVIDLLLLRDLAAVTGSPTLPEIREAATAVFSSRADETSQLGLPQRTWPPLAVAHSHWSADYPRAAESAQFIIPLDEAVAELNEWIEQIESA